MRGVALNAKREEILRVIQARPGSCFRDLIRTTGLASGTVAHHLRMLKRAGRIREARLGPMRTFYPTGMPLPSRGEAMLVRDPALTTLGQWVATHGPMMQARILRAMQIDHGWPRSSTQNRLRRLVALGMLDEVPRGPTLVYSSPALRTTAAQLTPPIEVQA